MSNQAFSRAEDLLFGSGELYFLFDDDIDNGWKHLGNVDEFIITTELESIDKNSSFNKKRELQARTTTQLSVSASATLTEYDVKNLSSALFGDVDSKHQIGRIVTDQVYSIPLVPGLITVIDENSKRYYDISDVKLSPRSSLGSGVYWTDAKAFGTISTVTTYHDTFISNAMGGTITISSGSATITTRKDIWVCIEKAPTNAGDLLGMRVQIYEAPGNTMYKDYTTSMLSDTITLGSGIEITFTLTGTSTFSPMGLAVQSGIKAVVVPPTAGYIENIDYIADRQSCRAGIIKIPEGSRIVGGDEVVVSCIVPDRELQFVTAGTKEKNTGQLLYVADNNCGPNFVIEAWKVIFEPEGDLTGLISSGDFGSYKVNFTFLTDYEGHPGSPYYTVTLIDNGIAEVGDGSIYDPES